jgi:RNA polymerase primary sigma factor
VDHATSIWWNASRWQVATLFDARSVNEYLPDEAVNPDKLDSLLIALDELGIPLLNEPPEPEVIDMRTLQGDAEEVLAEPAYEEDARREPLPRLASVEDRGRWNEDPVRMYLTQMAEIPLLTREQEISLAKKIEVTRKRFRRTVLGCDYAMQATIDTLASVHEGSCPSITIRSR